ncbi:hypothetical protein FNF28_04755 [Cafeteria roenbergensis]|uniref:Uncharacterized protein n=1 Tax=Cafeteria roenbergensis TaxID=33653 RepID=A0A5A8DAD7_CAFRO|nr:hypothetical protein FNF28_04755 [Cafeteria roenbergensis]
MTALMALVRNPGADSAAECIELLRSIGSDFLLADNAGFTALHYAAMTGNAKAARQIVKLVPAAVTVCDKTGSPPISLAVSSGKITVVRALLSLEDGVEASPESGEAAAPIALSEEAAVSLTLADAEGNTALHYASASGAGKAGSVVPCAQLLARLRPELLTTLNVARLAPADLAIVCGNNQVAEALLEAASS